MLSFNSSRKQTTERRSSPLCLVLTVDQKSEFVLNLLRLEPNNYIQPATLLNDVELKIEA